MSTRLVSPPDLTGDRPIDLGLDGDGGGGGADSQHIRPTTSSSPPLIPNSITQTRRIYRSSSPTTTTQQPRPSPTPPPFSNLQTPPPRRGPDRRPSFEFVWLNQDNEQEDPLNNIDIHDHFLADLVDGDFSSPSTYPSFTDSNSRQSQTQGVSQPSTLQASTPHPHPRAFTNGATNAPRDPSTNCISNILGPERTTSQLSSSTNTAGESQSTLRTFDSFDEHDSFDSPASSFSDAMPPALRRTTTAAAARTGSVQTSKRRRTSTTAAPALSTRPPSRQKRTPVPKKDMEVEELFGSSPLPHSLVDLEATSDLPTIDLTETNEVLEDPKKPEKDDRVKLAAFQCVICMDDCSNLTVTHCGKQIHGHSSFALSASLAAVH
ncbi:hypothetical protein FSARC_13243 [Fusarium sarcochroum]|uniref:Uncharacterized protein n=1 Tax=Fusarium sarcochroum TaxID=1208366 RepID=A0A8H4T2W5_9HYPO|nr:hypothetical protein FSARC_13243 [Fusarium sarcochroum]